MDKDFLELIQNGILGITKTDFMTVTLPANTTAVGVAIGVGKCKAVRLQLNTNAFNTNGASSVIYIYYGDPNNQAVQLSAGATTDLIPCRDLQEIFVRNPFNADAYLQVLVYQ